MARRQFTGRGRDVRLLENPGASEKKLNADKNGTTGRAPFLIRQCLRSDTMQCETFSQTGLVLAVLSELRALGLICARSRLP